MRPRYSCGSVTNCAYLPSNTIRTGRTRGRVIDSTLAFDPFSDTLGLSNSRHGSWVVELKIQYMICHPKYQEKTLVVEAF